MKKKIKKSNAIPYYKKPLIVFSAIVLVAVFGAVGLQFSSAARGQEDLKAYYPNEKRFTNYYLEGYNYANGSPSRSVFWFEQLDQWSFKAYNSAPENADARCNWDLLSWWDDGFLRYAKTHHECPGSIPNEIVYDSPIIFLPRYWSESDRPWSYSGSSNANYYQNGQLRCTGVNNYTSEIIGYEQISPTLKGIHWRTTQTTTWETGDVEGKCYEGYKTNWREDYWLAELPINNGKSEKGLKRSKGGNLDTVQGNWDVWYDRWQKLP